MLLLAAVPIVAGTVYFRPWTIGRINPPVEPGPSRCWFKVEMRLLRAAISDTVGECIENERTNPENGDTLQRTTGGLMVWRKTDRITAFTDGNRTWALGPRGVETRANNERFDWEVGPTQPTPTLIATTAAPAGPAAPAKPIIISTPVTQRPSAPPPSAAAAAGSIPGVAAAAAVAVAPPPGDAAKAIFDAAIVGSLRQSGLPVRDVRALTAENDPEKLLGQPGQYSSKVAFKDDRGAKGDGAVEVFPDDAALKARVERLEALGKGSPNLAKWIHQSGNAKMLVHVSKDLTPEQARSYQTWLSTQR